jgi:hypothetical protein
LVSYLSLVSKINQMDSKKRIVNYPIDENIYIEMKKLAVEKRQTLVSTWEEAALLLLQQNGVSVPGREPAEPTIPQQ